MRAGLLAAILLCASCIPFPHRSYRTPVVHGRIVADGRPVANIPLRVLADPRTACEGRYRLEGRTNAEGEFAFCPMPDFQMMLFIVPAHRIFRWSTCAHVNGRWIVLHESQRYTLEDAGPREIERLDCDLGSTAEPCRLETDIDITPEKLRAAVGAQKCAGIP